MRKIQRNRIFPFTCLVCFIGLTLAAPIRAANFDKGIKAYNSGDYETALTELKPLAQKGDVKAQFNVGRIYSTRKTSSKDLQEAIKWFTKAAEQKDAFSQYTLGHMYSQEQRIYKNYAQSYAWFNLALSQGNETARKGRDAVMMKMTPKQVSEGQEIYKQIYKKIYGGR